MTATRRVEIAVVGAGPAGIAAALAARRLGTEVLLLDEFPLPGGQYHKQPRAPLAADAWVQEAEQTRRGQALAHALAEAGVEMWSGATVWGLFPDLVLGIDRGDRAARVAAQRLVIASGAHDRTLAFPGWTLPGVMTPGAAQTLTKSHGVRPGRRIVVAGTGPFLLVVAAQLAEAGADVTLIEAASWSWQAVLGPLGFPARWREVAGTFLRLRRNRVQIRLGHAVTAAHGDGRVAAVTVARLDATGRPVAGTEEELGCDTLAVAYGFRASSELARLAGCRHAYREEAGGDIIVVDHDTGRTSVDTIFAAGEVTGVAGNQVARAEGVIAGLGAARALGRWDAQASRLLADAVAARRRDQRFADLVNRSFAPPQGLTAIVTPETTVCRCEGVSRAAIDAAVDAGATTLSAVKMWTRCGMGLCQGRICEWTARRVIAGRRDCALAETGTLTPRVPIKPVPLAQVLALRATASD